MASAASDAENFVCAPISLAFARSCSSSDPVAPETAATLDIDESKSEVTLTAAAPIATIGAVTCVVIVLPTDVTAFPTFWILSPVACMSWPSACSWFGVFRSSLLRLLSSVLAFATACLQRSAWLLFSPYFAVALSSILFAWASFCSCSAIWSLSILVCCAAFCFADVSLSHADFMVFISA